MKNMELFLKWTLKAFVAVHCIPKCKCLLTAGVFNVVIYTVLFLHECWDLLVLVDAES